MLDYNKNSNGRVADPGVEKTKQKADGWRPATCTAADFEELKKRGGMRIKREGDLVPMKGFFWLGGGGTLG